MAQLNAGDTAWLLMATALVMVMLPGLALFYGGLVRRKNVLSTIMHSFFGLALVSVVWVLIGFSLAFGPDVAGLGLIGGLELRRVHERRARAQARPTRPTIPFVLFASFQLMFAAITPALITGAFAERKRFGAFVALHDPLVDLRLLAARALGLGARRLAALAGRARLRGRHRRPHQRRASPRSSRRSSSAAAAQRRQRWTAARRAHDRSRRRACSGSAGSASTPARAGGDRPGGQCAARHQHGGRGGDADLGPGLATSHQRKVSVIGAAAGAVAGPRRDHPGVRLRHGRRRACSSASARAGSATARRCCASALRVDDALDVFAVHGVGGMFGAVATGVLRAWPRSAASRAPIQGNFAQVGHPARRRRRDRRLRGGRHLRHRQGRRLRARPAGRRRERRSWASTWPSTARSPTSPESDASTATSSCVTALGGAGQHSM